MVDFKRTRGKFSVRKCSQITLIPNLLPPFLPSPSRKTCFKSYGRLRSAQGTFRTLQDIITGRASPRSCKAGFFSPRKSFASSAQEKLPQISHRTPPRWSSELHLSLDAVSSNIFTRMNELEGGRGANFQKIFANSCAPHSFTVEEVIKHSQFVASWPGS